MNVAVIGAGYVGLVTAACLADLGNRLVCVENNPARLSVLCEGLLPIYEEGLEELVDRNVAAGRLRFTADLAAAVRESDVIFLCVGTPPGPGGQPDLSQIEAVATAIGRSLDDRYRVIVTKSTVPVGSGDWVSLLVREEHRTAAATGVVSRETAMAGVSGGAAGSSTLGEPSLDASNPVGPPNVDVVSNPEFLREGSAIPDMMFPDRIVLGSASPRALEMMRELYRPLLEQSFPWEPSTPALRVRPRRPGPVPLVETDLASAEMIKYAANAFLATKISFINEIANICERTGADVRAVAQGIGLDHRIGEAFLQAGIGWGGSCFPKDVAALAAMATDYGYEARLLNAVRDVNTRQRLLVVQKLQERLKILKGKTIGLLGLAFKPGTDDLRDAPALTLASRLIELGAKVRAYDPHAAVSAAEALPALLLAPDVEFLAQDADALVLVTEWPEFRELPLALLAQRMRCPVIVDGRNCLDREAVLDAGLEYLESGGSIMTTAVQDEIQAITPELSLQAHEQAAHRLARGGWNGPAPVSAGADEPAWQALRAHAFRLWLDTGDLDEAAALWSPQLAGLTTNNTLVNNEVQTGRYDDLIRRVGAEVRAAAPSLLEEGLVREVGFVVNSRVALRLVERFDAPVSVELHPALAHDVEASVRFGQRYFAVCPERFLIKLPLTAAGCLATRRLSQLGIPVNFTLGFSARENVLAAKIARPAYVNVFLGRLNAFVADNGLGSGENVGEKAALATQRRLLDLRRQGDAAVPLLIAASVRSPEQLAALAGVDVMTIPPKVAAAFRERFRNEPIPLSRQVENDPPVALTPPHDLTRTGLDTLWSLSDSFSRYADALARLDVPSLTPETLIESAREHQVSLFHSWSAEEWAQIKADGKIPKYARWADRLASGSLGLDDLMSAAALASFVTDQEALDDRIRRMLQG